MKYCMHCGKKVKETVKFCPFCGEELRDMEVKIETIEQSNEDSRSNEKNQNDSGISNTEAGKNVDAHSNSSLININSESVNQFRDSSKNYLMYLNSNIKQPKLDKFNSDNSFGLISFFVINILLSLGLSNALGKSFTGSNFQFRMFLPLLLLMLVGQIINVGAVYILGNKIFKNSFNFLDVFEKIYSPVSLVVYIGASMFFLTLVSDYGFSVLFGLGLIVSLFMINISYIANIWVLKNHSMKKNKFYWSIFIILLAIIGQIVSSILLKDIVGGSLTDLFGEFLDSMTSNFFF